MIDLAVRGVIDLPRVASALAERPATLFGLDDRKGRIAPGLDGDLVLIDLGVSRTVEPGHMRSRGARSPFEVRRLAGWPVLTALRGVIIAANGALADVPVSGRLQKRRAAAGKETS